ncbi:MAG TPA: hypothetical protein PKW66_00795 [Polyangiaceae bacterium]|nr:hypothetical protein [Polyangiaceae bacterium]
MKLAPVLPLKKKKRTRQRVERVLLFISRKKKAKSVNQEPPKASARPPRLSPSVRPTRASTAPPSLLDASAALMGDTDVPFAPSSATLPKKTRKKPKKNPFLSTPVPETFRPPAPTQQAPSVLSAPLAAAPKTKENQLPAAPPSFPSVASRIEAEAQTISERKPPARPSPPTPSYAPVSRDVSVQHTPRSTFRESYSRQDSPVLPRYGSTTVPVRAVAIAHEKSNAVGTIELSCVAHGLRIQFVRISSYTEGFVPYPATSSERITVPYDQVAAVELDADGLVHLTLDPSVTPYHRLVLAGLARDPAFDHITSHRRRMRVERSITIAALAAWVPIALLLRALVADLPAVMVMGMAVSASLVLYLTRRDIATKIVLFNRTHEHVRDELLGELKARLAPGRVRAITVASEIPVPEAAPAELGEPEPDGTSLRGLFATAGVMAAMAAVAILIGKNLLFSSPSDPQASGTDVREPADPVPASEPLTSASPSIVAEPVAVVPPPPPCSCDRADSPLWAEGVPRMSVLAHNRPGPTSYERPSMYPEIAVVNNSSEDLKDIVMVVDFILGPRDGRKARVVDKQDLFWEGRLGPGRAVKWRVRGRGDDYSVTSFVSGMLGQEAKPAPADAFYKLSMTANTPSVRLHGTKMLAYLGDERVAEGLEKLRQEGREEMVESIEQIVQATRPLRVCSVQANLDPADPHRFVVKACVFNASSSPMTRPWITATAKLEDSTTEARWPLPEDLPSKTGLITTGTVALPAQQDGADPKATTVTVNADR